MNQVVLSRLDDRGLSEIERLDLPAPHWRSADQRYVVTQAIDGELRVFDIRAGSSVGIAPFVRDRERILAEQRRGLDEKSERVLRAAWRFFGRHGKTEPLTVLVRNLERESAVRQRALSMLGYVERCIRRDALGAQPFWPLPRDALDDPQVEGRLAALRGMRSVIPPHEDLPALLEHLISMLESDPDGDVRIACAQRLWIISRQGHGPRDLSALERVAATKGPAAFFAGVARSQIGWQRDGKRWDGLEHTLEHAVDDIDEPSRFPRDPCGRLWCRDHLSHDPTKKDALDLEADTEPTSSTHPCGLCGCRPTTRVYRWAFDDNVGREWTDEVRCDDCGRYTVYEYVD